MGKSAVQKQQEADDAAVEQTRQRFGDAEAAILNRELIIKRTEPGGSWQSKLPVPLLILTGLLLFVFEVVAKAPEFFLTFGRFQATQAEYDAKLLQPAIAKAQLDRAEADAVTAKAAADVAAPLTRAQLARAEYDATVAKYAALMAPNQPPLLQAQLEKAQYDAKTAALQPNLTMVQFEKLKLETLAAAFMPTTSELQMTKLGLETQLAKATLPVAQQSIALTGALMNTFSPFMQTLLGIAPPQQQSQPPPQQQPPAPQAAVARPIPRVAPPPTQPPAPPPAQLQQRPEPITLALPDGTPEGDYLRGASDAQRWSAFLAGSQPDVREGSEFWMSVKGKPTEHSCKESKGPTNAGFRKGCEIARERFAEIDRKYKENPNYRAGWNSVR